MRSTVASLTFYSTFRVSLQYNTIRMNKLFMNIDNLIFCLSIINV